MDPCLELPPTCGTSEILRRERGSSSQPATFPDWVMEWREDAEKVGI